MTKKKWNIIKHKNLSSHIKLGKEMLMFGNIEIEKSKFYCNKTPVPSTDVDIEKVLVSNRILLGAKKTISALLATCIMIIKLNH